VGITIRLLRAYHDGHILFRYRDVGPYRLELYASAHDAHRGHRNWGHDDFRLSGADRVDHEIEWWGRGPTGRWLIEAAEVEYTWTPLGNPGSSE
jgi:hypothetical protein